MKQVLVLVYIWLSLVVNAQDTWQSLKMVSPPESFKATSILHRIGKYHATGAADVFEKITKQQIVTRADQRLYVEIVNTDDHAQSIDTNALIPLGLEIKNIWKNRASCWVEIGDILRVSQNLPGGYFMMPVRYPNTDDQGPEYMNSDSYINNGADGTGITIAVFDGGFERLTEAIDSGEAPPFFLPFDWPGTGMETDGVHGTACVETVYDHAPGALYQIHKYYSSTDFANAIDFAVNSGVDIISHSISQYNTGWDDNTGSYCAAVEDAANAGILFFTSAGNRNGAHWQGDFKDDDGDNIHEWSGSDEKNDVTVPDTNDIHLYLQWDGSATINYYDLYLYDAATDDLLESSTSTIGFEELTWDNTTENSVEAYIAIVHNEDLGTPEVELFHHSGASDFEYHSTNGSTTSPSNSTEPNCISVAAVDYEDYGAADGSEIIENYSSRGPTNNGNQAPDISGPTYTYTIAYTDDDSPYGAFGGTSCATPNCAGAAAAFWSGHLYLSDIGVRQILLKKASLYNDWGENGTDYFYGNGGMELYDYYSPTRYIDKDAGNVAGDLDKPYFNMQQADINAPDNAWIVFLGGVYNAVPGYIFARPLIYRSLIEDSEVK